jgi:hypothetical protein
MDRRRQTDFSRPIPIELDRITDACDVVAIERPNDPFLSNWGVGLGADDSGKCLDRSLAVIRQPSRVEAERRHAPGGGKGYLCQTSLAARLTVCRQERRKNASP